VAAAWLMQLGAPVSGFASHAPAVTHPSGPARTSVSYSDHLIALRPPPDSLVLPIACCCSAWYRVRDGIGLTRRGFNGVLCFPAKYLFSPSASVCLVVMRSGR